MNINVKPKQEGEVEAMLHSRRDFTERTQTCSEPCPTPTLHDQLTLEMQMVAEGISRFERMRDELINKNLESRTRHGRTLVASMIERVSDGVRELIDTPTSGRDITRKKLQGADPDKIAYLTLITIVDYLGSKMPLSGVAGRVGQYIEDQLLIERWMEVDEDHAKWRINELAEKGLTGRSRSSKSVRYYAKTTEEFEEAEKHFWTTKERIHVGVRLIDVVIRTTGLCRIHLTPISKGKVQNFIVATDTTLDWVKKFNDFHQGAKPRFAPCIITPRDWVSPFDGGYYSDLNSRLKLVKKY